MNGLKDVLQSLGWSGKPADALHRATRVCVSALSHCEQKRVSDGGV